MKLGKLSLCLALLVAASFPATAQMQQIKLNIPFSFMTAGKTLPAGHYTVSRVWVANNNSWQIVGNQGSAQLITYLVESPKVEHAPSLVFLQQGDRYSLVQIWDGAHLGRQLPEFNVKKTVVAQNSKYVEIGAE
jgi:hypothetical protein